MKKAILSNRIYLTVEPEYQRFLQEKLTYRIPNYVNPANPLIIQNYALLKPGLMSLPIGRTDLVPEDYQITEKRISVPTKFPKFKYDLRPSQQDVYDEVNDNCIINAKPSWGKTFAGLVLNVVHTVPLRNQWAREVEKVYGIEPAIIGSSKYSTRGPIVIGNVQSLYNCIDRIEKDFGTVILDEMHHVSSPTFSRVMDRCHSRYKIGLSGTIRRKDGKDVVFEDYFGKHIIKPPAENYMKPEVHVVDSGLVIPEIPGVASWAHRVNALLENPAYRLLIHTVADKYVRNHKLLVVADRVSFLNDCANGRNNAISITGETQEGREEQIARINDDINEIWGTLSIFKEGISQDILSCVILATPINNDPMLEQVIGRIQRILPGKPNPVVVDIKLSGWTGTKQFQARMGHYLRMGYDVKFL
jgi:superfamily II DNA or RNA helicase